MVFRYSVTVDLFADISFKTYTFLTDDELYVVVVAGTNMQKNSFLSIFIFFISGGGYWDWYNDLV